MRVIKKCQYCNKNAVEVHHEIVCGYRSITLECGHTILEQNIEQTPLEKYLEVQNCIGHNLREFQAEDCVKAEEANLRFLVTWKQGRGKTLHACALAALHKELRPIVVFCKATVKVQWQRQLYFWTDEVAQVVDGGREMLLPGYNLIVSFQSSHRINWSKQGKPKIVIIDEVQNIKNHDAKTTNAIREACKDVPYVFSYSGTPIKNHAGEFFPILNILRPELFPSQSHFLRYEVNSRSNWYGTKVNGLRDPEGFKKKTSTFIISRPDDCYPGIPKVERINRFVGLGDQTKDYERVFARFAEAYDNLEDPSKAFSSGSNILGLLQKLSHIAGLCKIEPTLDFVEEHLENVNGSGEKLIIFVHHKDVGQILHTEINKLLSSNKDWSHKKCIAITSEIPPNDRYKVVDEFAKDNNDFLVASLMASGEGLDGLQVCNKLLFIERWWNAVAEEQAEGRVTRPGSKYDWVQAFYMIAENSIDEYKGQLIERKRIIVNETMTGERQSEESSFMKELADLVRNKGRAIWKI